MCGRFTHRYTWAEIQRLYRLTSPASNVQPSYNVCPTDTVNVVTSIEDTRVLQPMRWGLIPHWWSKPLKELMRLNEHLEHSEGNVVFRHACKMGREGIVSKRLGSRYRSGRSPDWLKFKNPEAPAVRRPQA